MIKNINLNLSLFILLFTLLFYSPLHGMEIEKNESSSMNKLPSRSTIKRIESKIEEVGRKIPALAYQTEPETVKKLAITFNLLGQLYINLGDEYIKVGDKTEAANSYNEAALFYNYVISMIKNNEYLKGLNPNPDSQLNSIYGKLVESIGGDEKKLEKLDTEKFAPYDLLKKLREDVKEEIESLDKIKSRDKSEETYIEKSRTLFQEIAQGMKNFLAQLYKNAEEVVGNVPCEYAVIGLGSMALTQMTPYSDLEFAILIGNQKHKDYFKSLSQLVHFNVINLGETVIPTSKFGCDLSYLVRRAVNFDLGGKTPLGRKDKRYDLICTVDEMLNYMYNEGQKSEHMDKNLPYILQKPCFVHGTQSLFDTYDKKAKEFLKVHGESRAVKMLDEGCTEIDYASKREHKTEGNIKQFALNSTKSEGMIFNIKTDIYRLPDRLIYNLGLIYGIDAEDSWDTITQLTNQEIINQTAESNLKQALTFATNLRLKAYSHYGYQKEEMDYEIAVDENLNQDQKENLIKQDRVKIFKLDSEALREDGALYKYYYVTQALTYDLHTFCKISKNLLPEKKRVFFQNASFYYHCAPYKAAINLRLFNIESAAKYQELHLEGIISNYPENSELINHLYSSLSTTYFDSGNYVKAEECLMKTKNATNEDSVCFFHNLGMIRHVTGHFKKGYDLFQRALEIQEIQNKAFSEKETSENLISTYTGLGLSLSEQEKFKESLEYTGKALSMSRKMFGENHPLTARCYDIHGRVLREQGQKEALSYLNKSLNIRKNIFGKNHPDIARSYCSIGEFYGCSLDINDPYKYANEYKEALKYYQKAIDMFEKKSGVNHDMISHCLVKVARICLDSNDYHKALEFCEKALKIREEKLGKDHPKTAFVYGIKAAILYKLAKFTDAESYFRDALNYKSKEEHSNIAEIYQDFYYSLSKIYSKLGLYDKALVFLNKELNIKEKKFGPNSLAIANIYDEIGKIYLDKEEYDNALTNYGKVLKIRKKELSENDVIMTYICYNIATVFYKKGLYKKAEDFCKKVLKINKAKLGQEDIHTAKSYNLMGLILYITGRSQMALKYLEDGKAITEKKLGVSHFDTACIYYDIGGVLVKMERYGEALANFIKAFNAFKRIFQANVAHEKITNSLKNIKTTLGWMEYYSKEKILKTAVKKIKNNEKHFYLREWGETDDTTGKITAALASDLNTISKHVIKGYKNIKDKINNICQKYKDKSEQKIAKMLCFEAICLGVADGNLNVNKPLDCLKKFCNENSDLVIEIAKCHPEYFVEEQIINKCIEYDPKKFESLKTLLQESKHQ